MMSVLISSLFPSQQSTMMSKAEAPNMAQQRYRLKCLIHRSSGSRLRSHAHKNSNSGSWWVNASSKRDKTALKHMISRLFGIPLISENVCWERGAAVWTFLWMWPGSCMSWTNQRIVSTLSGERPRDSSLGDFHVFTSVEGLHAPLRAEKILQPFGLRDLFKTN